MHRAEARVTLRKGSEEVGRGPGSLAMPKPPPERPRGQAMAELFQPPTFLRKMKNAAIGTGCDIRLKVAVTGSPTPALSWFKNKWPVGQECEEYGALWIRDCKPADAGVYTCIARNRLGEARSSAVLAVLDLEDSEECAEDDTFETQKPVVLEESLGPKKQTVQRVPAEGELESFMDMTSGSTPSSARTVQEHPPHSDGSWSQHSSMETAGTPSTGTSQGVVKEQLGIRLVQEAPTESPRDLSETGVVGGSSHPVWRDSMSQHHQGVQQETLRASSFPSASNPRQGPINPISIIPRPAPISLAPISSRPAPISPRPAHTSPASTSPRPSPISEPQQPVRGSVREIQTTPLTPRRKLITPVEYRDTVPEEFEAKVKKSRSDDYLTTDVAMEDSTCRLSPAPSRSGSRIFEKVKYFESFPERRRSFDLVDGQPWPGFRKCKSFDHMEQHEVRRRPSLSDLLDSEGRGLLRVEGGGPEQKRTVFKQKAASFDEQGKYAHRVHEIEFKISEELNRIKKNALSSMSKPQMKSPVLERALKRDLSARRVTVQRGEPSMMPKGARCVERVAEKAPKDTMLNSMRKPLQRGLATTSVSTEPDDLEVDGEKHQAQHPIINHIDQQDAQAGNTKVQDAGTGVVQEILGSCTLETQIQPSRSQLVVEQEGKASSTFQHQVPVNISAVQLKNSETLAHFKHRGSAQNLSQLPASSKQLRESLEKTRLNLDQEDSVPRLDIAPLCPANPSATPRPIIPRITIGERKDVEMEGKALRTTEGKSARKISRGKSKQLRPTSPETVDSSDDSYVSAGEEPLEPPVFEIPITDTMVTAGAEVLLKCIVTGTPMPEVIWKKDGEILGLGQTYLIKAEGERHTLLIQSASVLDGGLYSVSAANEVGLSSCSASVQIRADSGADRKLLTVPTELYSPITSDEEYLSPVEDPIDFTYKGRQALKVPEILSPLEALTSQGLIETHFKAPPIFEISLSDLVAVEGQNVSLTVSVQGEPKPIIYWLRNREPVKNDNRHYVLEGEKGKFHLNIVAVQRSDSGMYSCKAINEYGTKQCDGKLEVKARREDQTLTILAPARDNVVNAGESACFECLIQGPLDIDVDWLTKGKLVQPALLNCKMHFDGKKCKLLLNSVHEDDSGIYTCKVSTAKDEKTCNAQLSVAPSIQPLFTRKLEDVVVIEGRTARLDVKVSGTPPPSLMWMHFGEKVVESDNVRIVKDQGLHSLIITHAVSENEGEYSAIAQNPHGDAFCSAELYVEEPRAVVSSPMAKLEKMPSIPEEPETPENEVERFTMPDFIKPIHNIDVTEGKDAVLECQVTGLPYPTITWYHNGLKLESTEERRMTQYKDIHRLVIRTISHSHAGVYKSVIANKVGKATCYAHLYVSDVVPEPPDGPPVVLGVSGRTVTLKWNKPKKLDPSIDPDTLTYVIQSQVLGTAQWHVLKANIRGITFTIQSLNKGNQYLFRVQSTTSKSCSKPSATSEPVKLLDRGPYLEDAPCFVDKPDVVYAVENESVCITCTMNYVQANVCWTRNGVELLARPRVYELSMPDDDQHMLKIVKVDKAEVGEITCTASNEKGTDSCRIALELAEAPCYESIMEDIEVSVEETARFVVVVEGRPLPDINWYKDGKLLVESNHLSFVYDDNECSLVILNTTDADSGVYTCTARNLAGEVSCKAELTVLRGKRGNEESIDDEETILRKMRLLSDYYEVHQEIGRGAFSCIKRVTEKSSKVEFAAKFISFRAMTRSDAVRELQLISQLDHQNIVYFHDVFQKKNSLILLQELCSQEELFDRLIRKPAVWEEEIRDYIKQILDGISYLHQCNILHLDIKPDNILLADAGSESLRICDFGNAQEVTLGTSQYCNFGTPEYISPEIADHSPVSQVTDIWPVGVIAYIGLTGISPFFAENDKCTLFNIKNYNVAFEEKMFADLSREARSFVIKLLVKDKQRPNADECLQHPWVLSKSINTGKMISTDHLKMLVSRRKWQRSLINYKSSMVIRSIPDLLEDTSSHMGIGIPKHLKQNGASSVLSSSSDSDEIDEFPFIPMPLQMEFSSAWMSLNEIATEEEMVGKSDGGLGGRVTEEVIQAKVWEPVQSSPAPGHSLSLQIPRKPEEEVDIVKKKENGELKADGLGKVRIKITRKRSTEAEPLGSSDEESEPQKAEFPKRALRKGMTIESPDSFKADVVSRRRELRRGSSADSALALLGAQQVTDGTNKDESRELLELPGRLKKSVSMELPRRSPSPGRLEELSVQRRKASPSQEDYALKLELMRQRLLRGGSVDSKMSGLRGPLLEHLGIPDDPKKRTSSLERHIHRPPRPEKSAAQPRLTKAASSESAPSQDLIETRALRKSASFSQGEPTILHRRVGAPLELPVSQLDSRSASPDLVFALKESPSLSALTDPTKFDTSRPPTPVKLITTKELYRTPSPAEVQPVVPEVKSTEEKALMETPCMKIMIGRTAIITHSNLSAEPDLPESKSLTELPVPDIKSPNLQTVPGAEHRTPEVLKATKTEQPEVHSAKHRTNLIPVPSTHSAIPAAKDAWHAPAEQTPSQPVPMKLVSLSKPRDTSATGKQAHIVNAHPLGIVQQVVQHPAVFSRVSPKPEVNAEVRKDDGYQSRGLGEGGEQIPPDLNGGKLKMKSSSMSQCINIANIESEEVFEAKFKKTRDSSLTRSLKHLMRPKSEEKLQQTSKKEEQVYRPGPLGAPLQLTKEDERFFQKFTTGKSRSRSEQNIPEAVKDSSFLRKLSWRLKGAGGPSERKEEKVKENMAASGGVRKVSWPFGRSSSKERKAGGEEADEGRNVMATPNQEAELVKKEQKNSPATNVRKKIESTISGISLRFGRSRSEERTGSETSLPTPQDKVEGKEGKRAPFLSLLRRSSSEAASLKRVGIPQNQLAKQSPSAPSSESLQSETSTTSKQLCASPDGERRSRWDRWGLSRGRRDKATSQPNISLACEATSLLYHRSASDFPPVFHVKLKDQVLLEGDPLTLCTLPAGSPAPKITWVKDQKPLVSDDRIRIVSCSDGRELVTIMRTMKKDIGNYECVASSPLGTASSSCTASLARLPGQPGPPEIPQQYRSTALILWRASDTAGPCTYTLEQKLSGTEKWAIISAGISDCFYNATELVSGTHKFRVVCINKAGCGPYSQTSEKIVVEEDTPDVQPPSQPVSAEVTQTPTISPPSVFVSLPSVPIPLPSAPVSPPSTPISPPSASVSPPSLPIFPPSLPVSPPSLPVSPSSLPVSPSSLPVPPPSLPVSLPSLPVSLPSLPVSPLSLPVSPPSLPISPPSLPVSPSLAPVSQRSAPVSPPSAMISPLSAMISPTSAMISPPSAMITLTPARSSQAIPSPALIRPTRSVRAGQSATTSLSPISKTADGSASGLRHGVPQKPYTFMEEKARGRFGVVRECKENATGKLFMAKIIPYEAENKQAVLQEYEVLKALHHEKVMSLHEAYVTPRYLVLISENCLGRELLYSLIDRFRYSEDDVVGYIVQILNGLEYLHSRHIVHLDLKPDNIIVTYLNVIKLIDFGSAHIFNATVPKPLGHRVGTADYMSPEMLKGDAIGPPADIWGLGVLTYIMLSGRSPFAALDPAEVENKIKSAQFDITKCYPNASQNAALFLKKVLCMFPATRPSIRECHANAWLQDNYLMKLRRQTLTFTTTRLKEFLVYHQRKRSEQATRHKVLLRSYSSSTQPSGPK
eukprot:gi/632983154/ref/XP_007908507.1/ PREDICTED: striated muscle preferentially expressed protein kinase isoform X3 [Callorhinchus milii]